MVDRCQKGIFPETHRGDGRQKRLSLLVPVSLNSSFTPPLGLGGKLGRCISLALLLFVLLSITWDLKGSGFSFISPQSYLAFTLEVIIKLMASTFWAERQPLTWRRTHWTWVFQLCGSYAKGGEKGIGKTFPSRQCLALKSLVML